MEYIGRVIYNQDETHSGRCKIRVFGLFDELEDDFIPWFTPVNSQIFSSNGGGSLDVPKVGAIVRVTFSNDDYYSGEYSAIQCVDPALIKEIEDDYEGTHVLLFDSDAEVILLYQVNTGLKLYHKNASIILDPSGNIQLKHRNNSNVIEVNQNSIIITNAGGDGTNSTGTIDITSGNTINLTAPTVNIRSNNIKLGTKATDRVVTTNRLKPLLLSLIAELESKYPIGAVSLNQASLDSIGANTVVSM